MSAFARLPFASVRPSRRRSPVTRVIIVLGSVAAVVLSAAFLVKITAVPVLARTLNALAGSSASAKPRAAFGHVSYLRPQTMSPQMDTVLVAPLFIQNREFTSSLTVLNGADAPTFADVRITAVDGREITNRRIEFTPHSQHRIEVAELLMTAVSSATTGRITVTQSPDLQGMAILAQLSLTYVGGREPNYIDEELAMPSPLGSQILRGVAEEVVNSPLIAISSLSETAQHITIECLGNGATRFSKFVDLLPQETLLTDACVERTSHDATIEDFGIALGTEESERVPKANSETERGHGSVGVSLTSDSMPGSFVAFGLIPHKNREQFFSAMNFVDPRMILSPNTVFAGVPVGRTRLLPEGKFVPHIALTNFSAKDVNVNVKYATGVGTPTVQILDPLRVPARSTAEIALSTLQGNADLENSFVVTAEAAPGDLVAKVWSASTSQLREVEVLSKDEADPENGGTHPWSLEGDTESTLLLFNHSAETQGFSVTISAKDKSWHRVYVLQPMQTEHIELRTLVQSQTQDDSGRTLPSDAVTGQIRWFTHVPGVGKGRLLQSSHDLAMARSFSCGTTYVLCAAQFGAGTTTFPVGSQGIAFGYVLGLVCIQQPSQFCAGQGAGPDDFNYQYSWSSDHPSIIAIAGTSFDGLASHVTVNGSAAGSARISGQVYDPANSCRFSAGATGTAVSAAISQRISGTVSGDDVALSAYLSAEGTQNLGALIGTGPVPGCFIGNEARGTITPSNYTGTVIMSRFILNDATYMNSIKVDGVTNQDDTSSPSFRDDNPQSGGSAGKVYDVDAPGLTPQQVDTNTYRYRGNFYAYAVLPDGTRISPYYTYYVRVSCRKTASGFQFINDVPNDNKIAAGTTAITWNAQ
jgi:hypothetical protein